MMRIFLLTPLTPKRFMLCNITVGLKKKLTSNFNVFTFNTLVIFITLNIYAISLFGMYVKMHGFTNI